VVAPGPEARPKTRACFPPHPGDSENTTHTLAPFQIVRATFFARCSDLHFRPPRQGPQPVCRTPTSGPRGLQSGGHEELDRVAGRIFDHALGRHRVRRCDWPAPGCRRRPKHVLLTRARPAQPGRGGHGDAQRAAASGDRWSRPAIRCGRDRRPSRLRHAVIPDVRLSPRCARRRRAGPGAAGAASPLQRAAAYTAGRRAHPAAGVRAGCRGAVIRRPAQPTPMCW
jgi:hypothetical protein